MVQHPSKTRPLCCGEMADARTTMNPRHPVLNSPPDTEWSINRRQETKAKQNMATG